MHVHGLDSCRNCPFLSRHSELQIECMKSVATLSSICRDRRWETFSQAKDGLQP